MARFPGIFSSHRIAPEAPPRSAPADKPAVRPAGSAPGELKPRRALGAPPSLQAVRSGPSIPPRTSSLPGAPRPGPTTRPEAPIRALDASALSRTISRFTASLDGWRTPVSFKDRFALKMDRLKSKESWNRRVDDVPTALRAMKADASNVAYLLDGQPVGLLSYSRPRSPFKRTQEPWLEIHALASHPGSQGVGGALLEHAVNASTREGLAGKVRLTALPGAIEAYKAMGFRPLPGLRDRMELDPARSALWIRQGDSWRLRRHAQEGYVSSIGPPSGSHVPSTDRQRQP